MTHKATFKPSPPKRSLARRFTPLAWVLISLAALVLLLVFIVGGLAAANQPTDEPWQPTPLPPAGEGDTGTIAPLTASALLVTPTSTEWHEEVVNLTAEPTSAFPAWWETARSEDGHMHLPPEVEDEVWEALLAGLGCFNIADRDAVPAEPLEELTLRSAPYLADDPDVIRVACNGLVSKDQFSQPDLRPFIHLVNFGPRNPVVCPEGPTRCETAVAVETVGCVFYVQSSCDLAQASPPCILRQPLFAHQAGYHHFYRATLEYDEGEGKWKIVYLEVRHLDMEGD